MVDETFWRARAYKGCKGKAVSMILQLSGKPIVENLRNYPPSAVERLRALLTDGAVAEPDIQREGFYDVKDGDRVFFIHISPVSGKVILLASWLEETLPSPPAHSAAASLGCAGLWSGWHDRAASRPSASRRVSKALS
jgi:hypothetical protein